MKYLRALLNIKFLTNLSKEDVGNLKNYLNLRQENMDNLKNYIKIDFCSIRTDIGELVIVYNIFNYSIFDVKLHKFIEKKVELSGGSGDKSTELKTDEYKEIKTIQKQTAGVIEVQRKLQPNEISEINRRIKECKEKDKPIMINVILYVYIECKYVKEPIELRDFRVPAQVLWRIPHTELLNLQSINTTEV